MKFRQIVQKWSDFLLSKENQEKDIAIAGFERTFKKRFIISTSFEDIVQKKSNLFRIKLGFLLVLLQGFYIIRSTLFFRYRFKNDDQEGFDFIGDFSRVLGILGDVYHFWWIGFSLLPMVLRIANVHGELTGQLYYFTDLRQTENGFNGIKESGLSGAYLLKVKKVSILCLVIAKAIPYVIYTPVYFVDAISIFLTWRRKKSYTLLIKNFLVLLPFHFFLRDAVTYGDFSAYYAISAFYIRYRFKAFNDKVGGLLRELGESTKLLWQDRRQLIAIEKRLNSAFLDHLKATQSVHRANITIRWLMFSYNVLIPPIIAFSVFVIIYGEPTHILALLSIFVISLTIIIVSVYFPTVANSVVTEARLSYVTLNSVQARHGFKLTKGTQRKVIKLFMKCFANSSPSISCFS